MSLTDFLFSGSPPPSVTTYGSTTASLPPWFEAYQQALLGKGNVIAGEAYQPFQAPNQTAYDQLAKARQAGFTPDTLTGWGMGRDAAGSYLPAQNAATDATMGALGQSASGAASPLIQNATGMPSASNAGGGYLSAAANTWPSAASSYMNPFTDLAANRMAELSNRNLTENILPGINDNFVKSGMFGSSRQGDFTNRAVRDQQNELTGSLGQLYSNQFNQAAQQFGADQSRLASIGQTAGNLQSADMQNMLSAANLTGNFMNADRSTTGTLGQNLSTLGSNAQRLGLTGASIYQGIGQQQQQQQQNLLDMMYGNFQEQRDFPKSQAYFMNDMIRGLQAPQSTQTTSTGPANTYSAPPFAQILGAATGIGSLFNSFGKARGGRINYKRGGRVYVPRGGYLSRAA